MPPARMTVPGTSGVAATASMASWIPVGGAMSILRLIELLLIEIRSLNDPEEGKEA